MKILMKFSTSLVLDSIITHVNLGDNRLSGGSAMGGGQIFAIFHIAVGSSYVRVCIINAED